MKADIEQVFYKYTDSAGVTHWLTTGNGTTGGVKEYTDAKEKKDNSLIKDIKTGEDANAQQRY